MTRNKGNALSTLEKIIFKLFDCFENTLNTWFLNVFNNRPTPHSVWVIIFGVSPLPHHTNVLKSDLNTLKNAHNMSPIDIF